MRGIELPILSETCANAGLAFRQARFFETSNEEKRFVACGGFNRAACCEHCSQRLFTRAFSGEDPAQYVRPYGGADSVCGCAAPEAVSFRKFIDILNNCAPMRRQAFGVFSVGFVLRSFACA